MKKLNIISYVLLIIGGILFISKTFGLEIPIDNGSYFPTDVNQVIDTTEIKGDPLREGAYGAVNNEKLIDRDSDPISDKNMKVNGVVTNPEINNFDQAKSSILDTIKNGINYFLGILSFVALVYLIYHGFMIVFNSGDDSKFKENMKSVKRAIIALVGIGASYLIISFVVYILKIITNV